MVLGCGPIGLCVLLMLKQRGVKKVVMGDIDPEKLARAEEWGGYGVSYSPQETQKDVIAKLKEESFTPRPHKPAHSDTLPPHVCAP